METVQQMTVKHFFNSIPLYSYLISLANMLVETLLESVNFKWKKQAKNEPHPIHGEAWMKDLKLIIYYSWKLESILFTQSWKL